jgi:hypothetical protein
MVDKRMFMAGISKLAATQGQHNAKNDIETYNANKAVCRRT